MDDDLFRYFLDDTNVNINYSVGDWRKATTGEGGAEGSDIPALEGTGWTTTNVVNASFELNFEGVILVNPSTFIPQFSAVEAWSTYHRPSGNGVAGFGPIHSTDSPRGTTRVSWTILDRVNRAVILGHEAQIVSGPSGWSHHISNVKDKRLPGTWAAVK